MNGIEIHIGGQTRTLRFTSESVFLAQSLLPGKMTVREALSVCRDTGTVAVCAACAFRHEDKKVSPQRVFAWIDREPKKFKELEAKVVRAAEEHYRDLGLIEEDEPGEADGAGASAGPSTTGSRSSESQDAVGSTQPSSEG